MTEDEKVESLNVLLEEYRQLTDFLDGDALGVRVRIQCEVYGLSKEHEYLAQAVNALRVNQQIMKELIKCRNSMLSPIMVPVSRLDELMP